jgi:hypothetical protein
MLSAKYTVLQDISISFVKYYERVPFRVYGDFDRFYIKLRDFTMFLFPTNFTELNCLYCWKGIYIFRNFYTLQRIIYKLYAFIQNASTQDFIRTKLN